MARYRRFWRLEESFIYFFIFKAWVPGWFRAQGLEHDLAEKLYEQLRIQQNHQAIGFNGR